MTVPRPARNLRKLYWVDAIVPVSEVSNYQNQLKSVTGALGSYHITFSHYEPAPPHVQQQIVGQYTPHAEEE